MAEQIQVKKLLNVVVPYETYLELNFYNKWRTSQKKSIGSIQAALKQRVTKANALDSICMEIYLKKALLEN